MIVHTPVTPKLEKLRQEDHEFKPSLSYIARHCLKNNNNNNKNK
jgi:hypothetical protein